MKKILSIFLALAMTASALNVGFADEAVTAEDNGEDIVASEAAAAVISETDEPIAAAETTVTYEDDTAVYTFDTAAQAITKIELKSNNNAYYELNIPSSINGVDVKEIYTNDGKCVCHIGQSIVVTVTIPETITYIGYDAFWIDSILTKIIVPGTSQIEFDSDAFRVDTAIFYCVKDSYADHNIRINDSVTGYVIKKYIDQISAAEAYKTPETSSGTAVRNSDGKLNSVQIVPYREIDNRYSGYFENNVITGGITISIENGSFDRTLMSECEYSAPKSGETWDYLMDMLSHYSDSRDVIVNTVKAANSNELPYMLEYVDASTIKVYLFPIDEKYTGVRNGITSGIPTYNIALPVVAGTKQGEVKINIKDDLGAIEDCSLTYAYVGKSTVSYTENSNIYMERNVETQPNTQFDNSVIIKPTNDINKDDYIEIRIENGSFDSKLAEAEEYQYHVDKSGETWDELMEKLAAIDARDVLVGTVAAATSNELPYKLTYIDSHTLGVTLFPLPGIYAGYNGFHVTYGIPVYSIKLPVVSGGNNGNVLIAVDGKDTTIRNGGWYTAARINTEPEYEKSNQFYMYNIPDVSKGQNLTDNRGNALVFKPNKEVLEDTELYISVKNGKFDKSLIDTCAYSVPKSGETWDVLYEMLKTSNSHSVLSRTVYEAHSNEMPYKMEYISDNTLKVCLFPLKEAGMSNSYVSFGIPIYRMRLPIVAGNNNGNVDIKIDSNNGSTVLPAGWYTAAVVTNGDKPVTTTTEISTQPTTTSQTTTKQTTTQTTTQKQTTQSTTQKQTTQSTTQKVTEKPTETTTKTVVTEKPTETTTKAVVTEKPTETTTKAVVTERPTQTTTQSRPSGSSGGSGGGGGGGKGPSKDNTTTATTVTETSTETTTAKTETGGGKQNDPSENNTDNQTVISGNVSVTIGKKSVTIDSKKYDIDTAPYIQPESNSTLVPLRFVALAIAGGDIENADSNKNISWDAVTKTATITAGNNVISFTAGSELMLINNNPQIMENGVKAEIKDSRMFIPFRALGKALGVTVDWNADTKTAVYKVK